MRPTAGEISLAGQAIHDRPTYRIVRAGIGLVQEGRQIFPNLTVTENLIATAANRDMAAVPWTFETVLELFPAFGARLDNRGNLLSGGEQQMLAVGRALMAKPRRLILDEATEGLAPLVPEEIGPHKSLDLILARSGGARRSQSIGGWRRHTMHAAAHRPASGGGRTPEDEQNAAISDQNARA